MTAEAHAPPQNLEAEESVLGALMAWEPALDAVLRDVGLDEQDFYRDRHRLIYGAIHCLHERGEAVDAITVSEVLRERNQLEEVGGRAGVSHLASNVPVAGNAKHYAEIVKRNADLRRLLDVRHTIERSVAQNGRGAAEIARLTIEELQSLARDQGSSAGDWLVGAPLNPLAEAVDPLPALPGFPFLHAGAGAVIVGPTGGGRSSLIEACAYDAARAGLRVAYLGSEVTEAEFNARSADLAARRNDRIGDALREQLAAVRYLDLPAVIPQAWRTPERWRAEVPERFDVVAMDPVSVAASVLDLDFDRSNAEFVQFYDRLIQPIVTAGVAVVMLDNLGHALEARARAKGASAKQDRPDLTFACKLIAEPLGLAITAKKVRSVRAPFARGGTWVFSRETQRLARGEGESDDDSGFRPTVLMQRVAHAIEANPGLSKRALREAVRGDNRALELALELLISEGYVDPRPEGRAVRHFPIRKYASEVPA